MDRYESSYPSTPHVPPSLRHFFETFYRVSDTPEAHDEYVECFTNDGVVIMASARAEGSDGELPFILGSLSAFPPKNVDALTGLRAVLVTRSVFLF